IVKLPSAVPAPPWSCTCRGRVTGLDLPCIVRTPSTSTCDLPSGATVPLMCCGVKTISEYFGLSRISLCIFLSRPLLPLSPLVASTTSSPPAWPVALSNWILPRFSRKSPCTVCSVESTVKLTLVWAGSSVKVFCCACASEMETSPVSSRKAMRRRARTVTSIYVPRFQSSTLICLGDLKDSSCHQQLPAQLEQSACAKVLEPEFAHVDGQHPRK